MANPVAFPNRPFNLRTVVWAIQQDVANNRTLVGWQLWVDKVSYSPSFSGDHANRYVVLNGVFVNNTVTNGFNFVNGSNFLLGEGQHWIGHNDDGTGAVSVQAAADFAILGLTPTLTDTVPLATIPRASVATFAGGSTFDAGTAVTINTNRASGSFTHDITFEFGPSKTGTIATGVGSSVGWTPPLHLLEAIPNLVVANGSITVVTKNGATVIGSRTTTFTLRAPASVKPTISSLSVTDDNPTVASVVGKFVQGLSILKATVNAAGIYGSTITARSFKMGATTVNSGGTIPVTASGTVPVTASATDSRSRVGTFSGSIPVLPYAKPSASSVVVRRADAGGTLNDNGTSLRVDLTAAVSSLVNSTERNSLKIEVFTRPYGGSSWTPRNVINHGALTYNSSFVVSGGANYPINQSFDVLVKISDQFNTAQYATVVATSSIHWHVTAQGWGLGKYRQNGMFDVAGDIYADGKVHATGGFVDGTDTGWVDLSSYLVSGFTGSVQGRRIGNRVQLRSNNISGSIPAGGAIATNVLNALPADWRPSDNMWGVAVSNDFRTGACLMRAVGTFGIVHNSGATWTSTRFTVDYFTG